MKPLTSIKIIEFAGLGPAPFAAMTLADLGANVTRITRLAENCESPTFLNRRRTVVQLDLKSEAGLAAVRKLIKGADVLIEGFRPGKMEGLGLGPNDVATINSRIIYARMTGWGQRGPMAMLAGHDINYLGLTGMLSLMGEADRPPLAPMNLVADFGGGGMYLAFGVLAAVIQARETGTGQVVDAGMVHGVTHLASMIHAWIESGRWHTGRQENLLDGGAPFYRCYETADGRYMAVGSLEPVFFRALVGGLELDLSYLDRQMDREIWPAMRRDIASVFLKEPREYWVEVFTDIDACVTPVLSVDEAKTHPQLADSFMMRDGILEPAPAPHIRPLVQKDACAPVKERAP